MSWLSVATLPIRSASIIDNSGNFIYTNKVEITNQNQVTLIIDLLIGSLTQVLMTVQLSPDGENWYDYEIDDTQNSVVDGAFLEVPALVFVRVFTLDANHAIQIPVKGAWFRAGFRGDGTNTDSSLAVSAMLGKA